jgi:hypothetical protein
VKGGLTHQGCLPGGQICAQGQCNSILCGAHSVGDHEYACMHDLMMHLRDEPEARYSNVHDVFDI